jgi:hypothetical protein
VRLEYAIDMRYGVLYDVASKVFAGRAGRRDDGHVNVIWQGDANEQALRLLGALHGADYAAQRQRAGNAQRTLACARIRQALRPHTADHRARIAERLARRTRTLRSACSVRRASARAHARLGRRLGRARRCRASASRRTSKRGMASTEVAREHPLGMQAPRRLHRALAGANWNQNAADWRLMLEIGRGYGLTLADGTLAATTITLPYASSLLGSAWCSCCPSTGARGMRRNC